MIRKNQVFLNRVNILIDMVLVILSYIFASWMRLEYLDGQNDNMAAISEKTILLAIAYSLVLFFLLSLFGFYSATRTRKLGWKVRIITLSVTLATLLASTLLFVFRLVDFSRGVLLVFYLVTLVLLIGKYVFMRVVLRRFRGKGYNLKHVLVIGTGNLARQYQQNVLQEPELGYHIIGFVGAQKPEMEQDLYLGGFDTLDHYLELPEVAEVVIALDSDEYAHIRKIISCCEKNGVRYSVIPFYNDIIPANPEIETIGSSKLINMRTNRLENMGWALMKRSFDLIVSSIGLIVLSPLFLIIAIGVKRSSPGPILFRQTRVGYMRHNFEMLKFRSLKVNSEQDTAWTTDSDSRRTKFGAFLRKTSMDELPQLINVLKGDMSLVGPRPELPHFVEQFRETIPFYMVKHQVKPGMTGLAQIHGYRGDTSIKKRIELDLWYIENWNIWLDLRILFMTAFGGIINNEKIK